MSRRKVETAFNMISAKNNIAANIGPACIAKSWIRVQDDFSRRRLHVICAMLREWRRDLKGFPSFPALAVP